MYTSALTPELIEAHRADHEAEIGALRADLATSLTAATDAVNKALQAIERLSSDDVYDTEFADGPTDTADFLVDAARMLRAAAAFNPATA